MRVVFLAFGLSITAVLLNTATVHAQSGPFSATRKMQGITRASGGNNSPATNSRAGSESDDSIAPPTVEIDAGSETDTAASVMKPDAGAAAEQPQSVTPQQPTVKAATRTGASGGLKSFQQRLTAARNSSSDDSEPRAAIVAAPIDFPGAPASPPDTTGPNNGPTPPNMPDIGITQHPLAPAPLSSGELIPTRKTEPTPARLKSGESVATKKNEPTLAQPPAAPGEPIVNGPVPSAKHISISPAEQSAHESESVSISKTAPAPMKPESDAFAPRVEPNPAGNVLFSQQSPMLGVQTTGPRSINVGKEAPYVVTIINAGQTAVQDLTVSVKIPSWADIVDTKASNGAARSATNTAGEPLLWRLPRLEAHSKEQLALKLVPRESRPFDLAVQWTFSPVASQAMVEVKEPKLTMSLAGPKEVIFGQSKVYKLTLSNPGTGDAENVTLFLSPIDGGTGAPTRHDLGMIRSGDSKLVEVELTARQAGTLQIKAAAMAEGNLRAEVAEEIIVHRAGLKLVASGPDSKFTGTAATFKILVRNPGNATAENISLAAMLPVGAKYLSSSGGQYLADQNKVVWSMPSLSPTAEQELEVRCTLSSPGANRFQVAGSAASELSDSTAVTTNVEALADLKLEVRDPPGPIPVGDEANYEVHLRNRGTKAAENVDVAGYFSRGIEPISAQGGTYEITSGQVVFHSISSIAPGAELVLRIKARADKAGNHVFRAEVVCPAAGTKLATEETTLFFGDNDRAPLRTAAKPNSDGTVRPGSSAERLLQPPPGKN